MIQHFTHKGTEKLFEGRSPCGGVELAERVSGDTAIGHSLAYCLALESLAGVNVPPKAQFWRVVLLELTAELPDDAFLNKDIEEWLVDDVVGHYDEHPVPA